MTGENAAKDLLATKNDGELVANMWGWAAKMPQHFGLLYLPISINVQEYKNYGNQEPKQEPEPGGSGLIFTNPK